MTWSYVGLMAAAAAEIATRYSTRNFWWMVAGGSLAVVAVGQRMIKKGVPRALQQLRR